ncbi:MAG: MFS transporter [Sulfuricella sp.]
MPVSGWMADQFGTRRVFGVAVAVFIFSSILCGLSVNAPMLVAARIPQGIGAAFMAAGDKGGHKKRAQPDLFERHSY